MFCKKFSLGLIAFSIFLISAVSVSIYAFDCPSWVLTESGSLETIQAVLLATAMYIFAATAFKMRSAKLIPAFFAVLCYAFILREVDFDKMGLPDILVWFLYGQGRNITLISLFAIVLLGTAINLKAYVGYSLKFIFSIEGAMFAAAAAFLWIGYFFEREDGLTAEFMEETSETVGYCLMLYAAYRAYKWAVDKTENKDASLPDCAQ